MATHKEVTTFRHFNRFYTDYLGLLGRSLYGTSVNLTEARILYELDAHPDSLAADLMTRLSLDRGYVSRILKRFSKEGWVEHSPSPKDGRVKMLRLTRQGTEFMQTLHDKAAAQATDALEELTAKDKRRLLGAMEIIESILAK